MNLKKHKKQNKVKKTNVIIQTLVKFLENNMREYIIVGIVFLIGVFLGVMFINNIEESQLEEVKGYLNTYIETYKQKEINYQEQLKNNIQENILLVLIIWFTGSTVIGIPIVLCIIGFRGFCLGYAISACTYVLGTGKGILFIVVSLLIQNIIFIPTLLSLGVSCLKIYQSILRDKRRENVKIEIIRHTIFSMIMLILMIVSAILEVELSAKLLKLIIEYI